MNRLIDLELKSGMVWVSCPWDAQIVGTIKTIPGREFDKSSRRWSVPIAQIAVVIARLEPLHFKFTPRMRDWWKANRDTLVALPEEDAVPDVDPAEGYSVTRLNEAVRRLVAESFSEEVWIVAEIEGFDRNSDGHAFFELVERTAAGGQPLARVRAVMFATARARIARELAGDVQIRDGVRLRLRGRVELYVPSGSYQIVVEGVDAEWAIGAQRRKRDEILEQLGERGVAAQNVDRPFPILPLRVGVITALDSDAYNDFVHELERSGFAFDVTVHGARMQGRDTEDSIIAALDWFADRASDFDVVVVSRGGGSRGDLGYFDSLAIGLAVCEHPVKIVAGIGHQRDRSVLDFVAHSEKTPTAAAQALVAQVNRVVQRVEAATSRLVGGATARVTTVEQRVATAAFRCERAALRRLSVARRRFQDGAHGLQRGVGVYLARAERRVDRAGVRLAERALGVRLDGTSRELEGLWHRLEAASLRALRSRGTEVDNMQAKLRLADPRRLVERGFAIVRDEQGAVVQSASALLRLENARVELMDGVVRIQPVELVDE